MILRLLAVLAIIGCGFLIFQNAEKVKEVSQNTIDAIPNVVNPIDNIKVTHEISLPALMKKQFDGRDLLLGKVELQNDKYTRYQIAYKSGDLTISGIMNVPVGDGPFPVLVLNHGFIDPSIYTIGRGLRREQDYLAREGFIVLHPDYRNHAFSSKDPNTELNMRMGYVEDVINAVYAVKSSSLTYFDKEKIGMLGHSMGGGVTQAVIVSQPDLIDAAVLYAPVSSNFRDNFDRWTRTRPDTANKIIEKYGSPETSMEFWNNISPVTYFERVTVPIEIHHGTRDSSVPYDWSTRLERELKDKGKTATLYTYEGEDHEFGTGWPLFMQRVTDFFKTNLK